MLQEALRWAPQETRSHLQDYLNQTPSRSTKTPNPNPAPHTHAGISLATECLMRYTNQPPTSAAQVSLLQEKKIN